MTRLQRILAGLLALQLLLAAVVFWPRSVDGGDSAPLISEMSADEVAALSMENADGTRAELVRSGNGWIMANAADYPVDETKVTPVLEKLAAIKTDRLVARTDSSHKQLLVADGAFNLRLQIEMNDGAEHTLYIGSAPNARATHVRLGGQDETYLTGEINSWEINPVVSSWIDTTYMSVDQTSITSLVLENSSGRFEFVKDADGIWSLADLAEGEEFDATQISSLLGRISNIRMTAPLGTAEEAAYGLADPQATLTIAIEDSETQSSQISTLLVGAQDADDSSYTVKWSESEYYVSVASFNVETLVTTTRDDLLVPPPTPEPDETPAEADTAPTPES